MSIERITRSLALLGRSFGRDVDELFIEAYLIGLDGMSADEVEYAARQAIGKCRFMPAPVELREFVGKEPESALMKPSDRCRACQVTLSNAESRERGYCGPCWRSVLERQRTKRIELGSLKKMIGGA